MLVATEYGRDQPSPAHALGHRLSSRLRKPRRVAELERVEVAADPPSWVEFDEQLETSCAGRAGAHRVRP